MQAGFEHTGFLGILFSSGSPPDPLIHRTPIEKPIKTQAFTLTFKICCFFWEIFLKWDSVPDERALKKPHRGPSRVARQDPGPGATVVKVRGQPTDWPPTCLAGRRCIGAAHGGTWMGGSPPPTPAENIQRCGI